MNRSLSLPTGLLASSHRCLAVLAVVVLSACPARAALTAGSSADKPASTVAVADFELQGGAANAANATDAAFGLADVLAVELQRRGVVMFERQKIRLILAEKRFASMGLTKAEEIRAAQIPGIDFLVTGTLLLLTNQQFHVEASLLDAKSGRSVATFHVQGNYPDGLPGGLSSLADQIAGHPQSARLVNREWRANAPGSPLTPEVTLPFYRGVAYCLAGRPELAISWFRDAQNADSNYLAPRVWTVRAFEMLGFKELVEPLRQSLRDSPTGNRVLSALESADLFRSNQVSVAVLHGPGMDAAGLQFGGALRRELQQWTDLFVTDPAGIRALAAEMDLQLIENQNRDLELSSMMWSSLDVLIFLTNDSDDVRYVNVELRDSRSGRLLNHVRARKEPADCAALARDLRQHLLGIDLANSPIHLPPASSTEPLIWPIRYWDSRDREQKARLLKYVAEHPSDRDAIKFQLEYGGGLVAAQRVALLDHYVKLVQPDEPEAAAIIAWALCRRHFLLSLDSTGWPLKDGLPSVAKGFALLLERYPTSLAAHYARSLLAMEHIQRKEYAEAARLLLELEKALARDAPDGLIGPHYWANFHFFTGIVFHELGDDDRAVEYLSAAWDILSRHPNEVIRGESIGFSIFSESVQKYRGQKYFWANHFPERHPFIWREQNLREAVAEWRERLDAGVRSAGDDAAALRQLEDLITEGKRMEFLRGLVEHKKLHADRYRGRVTERDPIQPQRMVQYARVHGWYHVSLLGKLVMSASATLNQLAVEARDEDALQTLRRMAREFAEGLDASLAADCFEAVGEYEQALKLVEQAISHPAPLTRPTGSGENGVQQRIDLKLLLQKSRLLQRVGRPLEAADYVRSQLTLLDPHARLEAAHYAAQAYVAAGRSAQAGDLFADLARGQLSEGAPESDRVAACYLQAEYELLNGQLLEATELLREVARRSEGKRWMVRLPNGDLYQRALERLAQIRASAQHGSGSIEMALPIWDGLYLPVTPPLDERMRK